MNKTLLLVLLIGLGLGAAGAAAQTPAFGTAAETGHQEAPAEECLTCHSGIEAMSASHPLSMGCTVCHGGQAQAQDADTAHATLIHDPAAGTGKRNPSSLSVAGKSCAQANCHGGHPDVSRNHVDRVNKSLMATLAGVISGLRYDWAAQSTPDARYGQRAVADDDGQVPGEWGALSRLEALPYATPRDLKAAWRAGESGPRARVSGQAGDGMLRERCNTCHIDSPPAPGVSRSQGCAACHVVYEESGRYQGGDPTVPKDEPGHAAFHKMSAVPPGNVCATCHRSQTAAEDVLLPIKAGGPVPAFPGKGQARQDVHIQRGFDCVDCHSENEIMGDGNIYSRQHQSVEVGCETCHGDGKSGPGLKAITDPADPAIRLSRHYAAGPNAVGDKMALTRKGRKMTNVKSQKGKIVTVGKLSGRAFETPVIKKGVAAHRFAPHRGKLSCAACHAQWAPRCQGCHNAFRGKAAGGGWSPPAHEIKLEEPVLMIGADGLATPMLPQPRRTLTLLDGEDKAVAVASQEGDALGRYREWMFTNPDGYSGANLAAAFNPHSTGPARSCASCHLNPRALGAGEGELLIGDHPKGRDDRLEPLDQTDRVKNQSEHAADAVVTLRGERLAGSHQDGARPFNQKEISRILKAGNCVPCHDRYGDKIYWNLRKSYEFEKKFEHRTLRDKILKRQPKKQ